MSIRALVVGLGAIGMGYDLHLDTDQILSHARAIKLHPEFSLLGGIDSDVRRRDLFEKKYGCNAYPDVKSALQVAQPDVLIIAVPTECHMDILKRALACCKPKIILCEKPLSYDLTEAQEMLTLCEEKQVKLYVNYMRRSDPGVIEIKKRLDSGVINSPVKGVVWYSKGLLHNGSHFLNLLEYWLEGIESSQIIDRGRMWQGIDPEPDLAVSFKRGKIFFLAKKEEDYSHYTVELIASNGRLRYESAGRDILWQPAIQSDIFSDYRTISKNGENIENEMHRFQYNVAEQLALAYNDKEAHLSTGDDALQTLQSLMTILKTGD